MPSWKGNIYTHENITSEIVATIIRCHHLLGTFDILTSSSNTLHPLLHFILHHTVCGTREHILFALWFLHGRNYFCSCIIYSLDKVNEHIWTILAFHEIPRRKIPISWSIVRIKLINIRQGLEEGLACSHCSLSISWAALTRWRSAGGMILSQQDGEREEIPPELTCPGSQQQQCIGRLTLSWPIAHCLCNFSTNYLADPTALWPPLSTCSLDFHLHSARAWWCLPSALLGF